MNRGSILAHIVTPFIEGVGPSHWRKISAENIYNLLILFGFYRLSPAWERQIFQA
jgi:hypothetical protein